MATNVAVTDELFWKEVTHAAEQVMINHGLAFTIERGTNKAEVFWAIDEHAPLPWLPEVTDTDEYLVIEVREVEPKQPALLVP